jgi:hypothetical protein
MSEAKTTIDDKKFPLRRSIFALGALTAGCRQDSRQDDGATFLL